MSLGDRHATLRAMAHPARLRMLALLTGSSLTAADVARELGLTHANASYHLRNLLDAGLIVHAGEERIRGGVAKRYRYDSERDRDRETTHGADIQRAQCATAANELARRAAEADWSAAGSMTDAELWVDPEVWREIRDRVAQAGRDLRAAARPPGTPGTVRTSNTVAMFRMAPPP